MNSAKVVPDPATYEPDVDQRQFPVSPVQSPEPLPLQQQISVETVLKKKRKTPSKYEAKGTTLLFVLCLGLVLIIGGSTMTWWGTQSEVKDLLILGPGLLIIGFIFAVSSLVFVVRTVHFKVVKKKLFRPKLIKNDAKYDVVKEDTKPPTAAQLYDVVPSQRKTSLFGTPVKVGPMTSELKPDTPMVTFPNSAITSGHSPKKDGNTWTTQINPTVVKSETESHVTKPHSADKKDPSLVKSRPDSGYEAETPDLLDRQETKLTHVEEV